MAAAPQKYTSSIRAESGGGRPFFSWVVMDSGGNRVRSGTTPSRAAATLAAERAIWQLKNPKADQAENR
jgi:hypothetical protein